MFDKPLHITPDYSLPADASDYQLSLALLHLRFPSLKKTVTEDGHILFRVPDRTMMLENCHVLLAEGFIRTREGLKALQDQHEVRVIWDPLNDQAQANLFIDHTVRVSVQSWTKTELIGVWTVEHIAQQPLRHILLESEISVPMKHDGRDLRRVACEAYLMRAGWQSELFMYHDPYHDLIRPITLTRRQYEQLAHQGDADFFRFHRRLIWFPSLTSNAALAEKSAYELQASKAALCRKELKTRSLIVDSELTERITSHTGIYQGQLIKRKRN